ncbi:MAG: DNA-binding domain-containing protein [Rhodospirillaceae bacterium]|nr:DNA-binding domain-containing protein [Rhodospirillaceae bacterium]
MLPELQRAFRDTVLGGADRIVPFVAAHRGPLAGRIAVYRNTMQASLTDVLAAAYPVVRRIVGERFFATLARRYIAAHPPRVPQLSDYGADVADFIAAAEPLRALAYLPDVARLEWARGEAYFAADAAPLDPLALAQVPAERVAQARFVAHPAARLIRSGYPIHRIWTVNQPEVADVPAVDMTVAETALITRPARHVVTRRLGAGDAALTAALLAGASLADAAHAGEAAEPGFDLQVALEAHLTGGTFNGVGVN